MSLGDLLTIAGTIVHLEFHFVLSCNRREVNSFISVAILTGDHNFVLIVSGQVFKSLQTIVVIVTCIVIRSYLASEAFIVRKTEDSANHLSLRAAEPSSESQSILPPQRYVDVASA